MLEEPKIKKVDKRDKQLPQNFEQLIEMYDIEKIWPYMKKVIDYINNDLEKVTVSPTEPVNKEEVWLQKGTNNNLINKETNIEGYDLSVSTNGQAREMEGWFVTDFITVEEGKTYVATGFNPFPTGLYWYDENKVFICRIETPATAPEGAKYVRLNGIVSGSPNPELIECLDNKILIKNSNGKYEEFLKESVVISSTEPTDRRDVWIQKGKNLIDVKILNSGYVSSTGVIELSNIFYGECYSSFIPVKPNTTYTFKMFEFVSVINDSWYGIGEYSNRDISSFINRNVITGPNITEFTFITSNTTKYIIVSGRNLKGATKIQLEQSAVATEYEEYIEKKIYCKNDNGVFEEFVNVNSIETNIKSVEDRATALEQNWYKLKGDIIAGADFNNYNVTGIYQYGGTNGANRPPNWGIVEVITSGDYVLQRCFGDKTLAIRISYDKGASWNDWRSVAFS